MNVGMNDGEKARAQVEAQLKRMRASDVFANAGRMFPLLEYLVRTELEDRGDELSQHSIAVDGVTGLFRNRLVDAVE